MHRGIAVHLGTLVIQAILVILVTKAILVNLDTLEKIIDAIGGVTVNIDEKMYYVDYAGGL